MKLIYKDPGYKYSAESISEFIKQDEFWSEPIFHFFPELIEFKGLFNKSSDNKNIIEEILGTVLELYKSREKEIQSKVISYQENWNRYEKLINERFSSIFEFDTREVFNDLVCNITLNPISPRYLKEHTFDVFYMNSDAGSIGSALHEIVHYLWFYLWNQKYKDSYEQYESPSLIWILSEAVVEQILKDKELDKINPYHKNGNAYPYFYKMNIGGRLLYDYLDEIYKDNSIDKFMDKSYKFMVKNEEEIRSQML
ncbi:hypothetical protein RBU61_12835 [Tissierella sp. MB52-C2]|uniref:hypothetical protein n=1 Tax=Tissierella sp. MB52-C2 TaxID=3070999 RepID=UPI00280A57B5|nr:hypothetical protein [Tissierella sp. MB52-C2]WMM23806.1 hypothetical protein RBU61_12835 [Tissierella sp. MB52-C2]